MRIFLSLLNEQKILVIKVMTDILSKALAYLLRHGAIQENIAISMEGWMKMQDVILWLQKKYTGLASLIDEPLIREIVKSCPKQRLDLREADHVEIRATQGHSIKQVQISFEEITDPDQVSAVIHGTNENAWKSIETAGLSKMGRNYIHFAAGLPEACGIVSGIRKNSQVLIYIDLKAAIADNIKFYRSKNGVILSEGIGGIIAPKYFEKIVFIS